MEREGSFLDFSNIRKVANFHAVGMQPNWVGEVNTLLDDGIMRWWCLG